MIWFPKRPETLDEARVRRYLIQDQILKILYVRGVTRGVEFSEILRRPYVLLDQELSHLRDHYSIGPAAVDIHDYLESVNTSRSGFFGFCDQPGLFGSAWPSDQFGWTDLSLWKTR